MKYQVIVRETWDRSFIIDAADPNEAAELVMLKDSKECSDFEFSHTDRVKVFDGDDAYCERELVNDHVIDAEEE